MCFEAAKQTCKEYKAKNVTSAEWSNQIVQNNIVTEVVTFYLTLLTCELKSWGSLSLSQTLFDLCLFFSMFSIKKKSINKLSENDFCVCISGKGLIFDIGEFWEKGVEQFNTLNAELNPICRLLALLRAHHILHVSRIRVKYKYKFLFAMIITTLNVTICVCLSIFIHTPHGPFLPCSV